MEKVKGDFINFRAHTCAPWTGLSYSASSGILLDDAGTSEGWDVVDVLCSQTGKEISIYCFSIER